jgi:hypothetical protein
VVKTEPTNLPPFDLTDITVTQADLADAKPAPKGPVGKPRFFINGKKVDAETAEKIMREGPGGKKIRTKGVPEKKAFRFNGKPGDAEPAQKKPESP